MEYFDSHCHYTDEWFEDDQEKIIKDVYNFGVTKLVSAGYSLDGSKKGLKLAKKYDFIYTTLGISPNDLTENYKEDINKLEQILQYEISKQNYKEKIVAIGEIGLDYHYDTNKDWQKESFISQINLANKYNLPIVIHERDAVMDCLEILKTHKVKKCGIFHCCQFNRELIKEALKMGYYISFSGTVTFKNATHAEESANQVPLNKMLIETDSPYLAPVPNRGKRNDSRNLKYIVEKIAEFRKDTPENIAKQTYKNALKIYEIKN